MRSSLLGLALFSILLVATRAETTYAPFRADMVTGDAYFMDARQLHPVQLALGWREVVAKKKIIEGKTAAELITYLKEKDVPVVIGPGSVPYLIDGHHTMRALIESRVADKTMYGHILANWSKVSLAEFWIQMDAHHYSYLKDAEGHAQPAAALPDSLLGLQHDLYRGLAWGVMKAGGFEELKGVYFQEFLWGDYFRDKIHWEDSDDAAFARAVKEACVIAQASGASQLAGYKPPARQ